MPPGAFAASGPGDDLESKSRSVFAEPRYNPRIHTKIPDVRQVKSGLPCGLARQQNCRGIIFRQQCRGFLHIHLEVVTHQSTTVPRHAAFVTGGRGCR
jgi:hypothetical protein